MKASASPGRRLVTLQKASDESGIPTNTLRDLIARGHLARHRLPDCRRVYVSRVDLDDLIARSREVAA